MESLMLIDGNSILNRAFYGLQGSQLLATSDGLYTNAVYGFLNILFKYIEEEKPAYLCVAFDLKAPTFRHKEFEGYKAKRKGMPPELAVQVPLIKEVLDAMNITRLELEGYEADDIIGSISLCAEEEGVPVAIVTGDRDSLQLVSPKTRVKLPTTKKGGTITEEYDEAKMMERYGVTPLQFIDVKGLMGDPSDNIPGVPGVGEKTAISLIKEYGSIEGVYENIEDISKPKLKEKLEENKELAFLSKKLATIDRHMPGLCGIEELRVKEYNREKLVEVFEKLEFRSYIEKLGLAGEAPAEGAKKDFESSVKMDDIQGLRSQVLKAKEVSLFYLLDKADPFTNKLSGIALSSGEDNTYYFDLRGEGAEEECLKELKTIFEDGSIQKVGHDMKNFIVYLKRKGIHFEGLAFDTMIGAYIMDPSREVYTVSGLASDYLGISIHPVETLVGKGKNFMAYQDMLVETISVTAGTHSEVILNVSKILKEKIKQNVQEELYFDIELPLVEILADMEYWGFRVHVDTLKQFSTELEEKINALVQKIYTLAGEEFNINSTKQLGVILFDKLKLPVLKKTKTGYSTSVEVLEQLASSHEIVSIIMEYRQLVKLKSTYVEGLLNVIHPATGRIHSSFNQTVTATGRISSTEPNMQNIPIKLEMGRKIRKVFVPENEEYVLLDADYSQIELRVLSHITGDENMISAFVNNEDIHTQTAAQVFGMEKEEVTSVMRSRAKAVNFGIVYGIGDFSLSKDLGITRKEARKYIDQYLDKYPKIKKYMDDIVAEGKENGFVKTIFNRRRYLPELQSKNFNIRSFGERIAMNTPIQGSAADIIKVAMVKVYKELAKRNLKSRLILQVHDELIIEAHKTEEEEVARILKESMENAVPLSVPLTVEVKSGSNWYETK